jgi:hypothetical protein
LKGYDEPEILPSQSTRFVSLVLKPDSGDPRLSGKQAGGKGSACGFPKDSPGDSISKQRKQWEKNYTTPGALDRWIEHMRIAGLPE